MCAKFSSFSYIRALCPSCRRAAKGATKVIPVIKEPEGSDAVDDTMEMIVKNECYLARRQSRKETASRNAISFTSPTVKELKQRYLINDEFLARRESRRLFYAVNCGKAPYDEFLDAHYYHGHLKGLIKSFDSKPLRVETDMEPAQSTRPVMTDKGNNFQPEVVEPHDDKCLTSASQCSSSFLYVTSRTCQLVSHGTPSTPIHLWIKEPAEKLPFVVSSQLWTILPIDRPVRPDIFTTKGKPIKRAAPGRASLPVLTSSKLWEAEKTISVPEKNWILLGSKPSSNCTVSNNNPLVFCRSFISRYNIGSDIKPADFDKQARPTLSLDISESSPTDPAPYPNANLEASYSDDNDVDWDYGDDPWGGYSESAYDQGDAYIDYDICNRRNDDDDVDWDYGNDPWAGYNESVYDSGEAYVIDDSSDSNLDEADDVCSGPAYVERPPFKSQICVPISPYDIARFSTAPFCIVREWEARDRNLKDDPEEAEEDIILVSEHPQDLIDSESKESDIYGLSRRGSDSGNTSEYEKSLKAIREEDWKRLRDLHREDWREVYEL